MRTLSLQNTFSKTSCQHFTQSQRMQNRTKCYFQLIAYNMRNVCFNFEIKTVIFCSRIQFPQDRCWIITRAEWFVINSTILRTQIANPQHVRMNWRHKNNTAVLRQEKPGRINDRKAPYRKASHKANSSEPQRWHKLASLTTLKKKTSYIGSLLQTHQTPRSATPTNPTSRVLSTTRTRIQPSFRFTTTKRFRK